MYRPRTKNILRAGLAFEGQHSSPDFIVSSILQAFNEGRTEIDWISNSALNLDHRFASAIFRTAEADIYAATAAELEKSASHVIVDSSRCRHKEHQKWDHVMVSTTLGLQAPFDWFCACMLQAVTFSSDIIRPSDTAASEHAIAARQMNTDGWMRASPARFFHLGEPFLASGTAMAERIRARG